MNSTISDNKVIGDQTYVGEGGGIDSNNNLILIGCTISDNSAFFGGGLYSNQLLTISSSTIVNNKALGSGGGISYFDLSSGSRIVYTTVYGNSARIGGGIARDPRDDIGSYVELWASIVAGNTADKGPDVLGPLYLVYPSLIQSTSDTAITFGDTAIPVYSVGAALSKKSIFGRSPKLGPLRNNGGATQTLALLPGSPAIGQIPLYNTSSGDISICGSSDAELPDVSPTDQRGSKRPGDHKKACDLGAYESAG